MLRIAHSAVVAAGPGRTTIEISTNGTGPERHTGQVVVSGRRAPRKTASSGSMLVPPADRSCPSGREKTPSHRLRWYTRSTDFPGSALTGANTAGRQVSPRRPGGLTHAHRRDPDCRPRATETTSGREPARAREGLTERIGTDRKQPRLPRCAGAP